MPGGFKKSDEVVDGGIRQDARMLGTIADKLAGVFVGPAIDAYRGMRRIWGHDQDPNAAQGYVTTDDINKTAMSAAEFAAAGGAGGAFARHASPHTVDGNIAQRLERMYPDEASVRDRPQDAPLFWHEGDGARSALNPLIEKGAHGAGDRGGTYYHGNKDVERYFRGAVPANSAEAGRPNLTVHHGPDWREFDGLSANNKNAAGAGQILDMSQEARLARAREMGFDTDNVLYHGTVGDFPEFSKMKQGSATKAKSAKLGAWLVDDPNTASGYADNAADQSVQALIDKSYAAERRGDWDAAHRYMAEAEALEASGVTGQSVMPLMVRGRMKDVDMEGVQYDPDDVDLSGLVRSAKSEGFDGLRMNNFSDEAGYGVYNPASHSVVFDPKNIRSVNAAFDPAKADSANLLAANPMTGGFALTFPEPEPDIDPNDPNLT